MIIFKLKITLLREISNTWNLRMGLWTHYTPLPNFDNYHFSNLTLSLPLLILLEYVKAKSTSFHPQIVLYELVTDKGFLFNHLTIITPSH